MKTLAQQVDELACTFHSLKGLAGEMLATIKLNVERGYLVAHNDAGKLNLDKIVTAWERQLAELTGDEDDGRHASAPVGYKCSNCTIDGEPFEEQLSRIIDNAAKLIGSEYRNLGVVEAALDDYAEKLKKDEQSQNRREREPLWYYLTHYDGRDSHIATALGVFTSRDKALAALERARKKIGDDPLVSELSENEQSLADWYFEIKECELDRDWF